MKITRLEILKVPPSWVWLLIHTDEGLTGIGEPYLENHPDSVIAEVQRLEPVLIGQDPRRVEALWSALYTAGSGYRGGPVTMSAISGIDMALWDLAGKIAGVPVHQMLGGAYRDRIRMYRATGAGVPHCVEPGLPYRSGRSSPPANPHDPQSWAEYARIVVQEWGFRCLKVHFSPGEELSAARTVDYYAQLFAAVREAAGPDVDVAVDIHNPHPRIGMQLVAALEPLRPLFIEEPMPVERVDALVEISRQSQAALAAGERWMGKWIFFEAIQQNALAVVQPDLAHAGGITECKKIAAIAEAGYAKVALHCPLSPVALAASIQLDACLPNFLVQEHNEVNDWRMDDQTLFGYGYLKEPFVLDADGCVAVPQTPGLGIELDPDGLRKIQQHPWSQQRG